MNILEELWLGNINPQRQNIQKDPRMEKLLYLVMKNDDAMRAMLSDIQKEQYEKLFDCHGELKDLQERKAFTEGFCLAAKIMMEVMNAMEIPSVDG